MMGFRFFAIRKASGPGLQAALDDMSKSTRDWEARAARGECPWICSDCGCSFDKGMPDGCEHGHESCTKIIARTKALARMQGAS